MNLDPLTLPLLAKSGVVGVGVDLVDVARFERAIARTPRLIERMLTPAEWEYCRSRPRPAMHAAARFAAKEAAVKALGCGIFGLRLRDVEVVAGSDGPVLALGDTADRAMQRRGADELLVSITHTDELAGAVVVALHSSR